MSLVLNKLLTYHSNTTRLRSQVLRFLRGVLTHLSGDFTSKNPQVVSMPDASEFNTVNVLPAHYNEKQVTAPGTGTSFTKNSMQMYLSNSVTVDS